MSRFTITPLAGSGVLVEGEDVRGYMDQEVLNPTVWEGLKLREKHADAVAKVDAAIEALVAPIMEAAAEANAVLSAASLDPLLYVVEQEQVENVPGQPQILRKLDRDSIVLRAIEEGAEDRLLWINGHLQLTAQPVTPAVPEVTEPGESPSVDGGAQG